MTNNILMHNTDRILSFLIPIPIQHHHLFHFSRLFVFHS